VTRSRYVIFESFARARVAYMSRKGTTDAPEATADDRFRAPETTVNNATVEAPA
jgi:hypothetical protein